jgi:hypothetical protein
MKARCLARHQPADTKRTHQKRHAMVRRGQRFESVRGLRVSSCSAGSSVVPAGGDRRLRRPRSVHQRPPWPLSHAQLVEQADRMVASVAGEVTVMTVDHGQAGAHVAGESKVEMQVEVAAPLRREEQWAVRTRPLAVDRVDRCRAVRAPAIRLGEVRSRPRRSPSAGSGTRGSRRPRRVRPTTQTGAAPYAATTGYRRRASPG